MNKSGQFTGNKGRGRRHAELVGGGFNLCNLIKQLSNYRLKIFMKCRIEIRICYYLTQAEQNYKMKGAYKSHQCGCVCLFLGWGVGGDVNKCTLNIAEREANQILWHTSNCDDS